MPLPEPGKIQALVVDDFSSFRTTMMSMLNKLGVKSIAEAGKAFEVFKWCKERKFDLILCDYNLGAGKNGQHILEELRFRKIIDHQTLFVMVTAEASKEIVLSAYDCEPDDYLMKPLNLQVLEQRISRLFQIRDALSRVYQLLDGDQLEDATKALKKLLEQRGRHTSIAQKLLGDTLFRQQRFDEALRLYQEVLETRHLDWAALGMARVQYALGEVEKAKKSLENLVSESHLFLPAHDEMARILEEQKEFDSLQATMSRVVNISPRSILRQRKLAEVAENNGDIATTLLASNDALKLGEYSCHQDTSDALRFLKAAATGLEHNVIVDNMDIAEESKRCVTKLLTSNRLGVEQELQSRLLMARVQILVGQKDQAQKIINEQMGLLNETTGKNIDVDLAYLAYLNTVGDVDRADALMRTMAQRYENDPNSMEKLDKLLPEPRSESNRKRVAQLNKTGIDLYKAGAFDEALEYFGRATLLFPRHAGLQLNRLQTLIAKMNAAPNDQELREKLQEQFNKVEVLLSVDENPAHMERFAQLRERARV